jgi:hypothetical protein
VLLFILLSVRVALHFVVCSCCSSFCCLSVLLFIVLSVRVALHFVVCPCCSSFCCLFVFTDKTMKSNTNRQNNEEQHEQTTK